MAFFFAKWRKGLEKTRKGVLEKISATLKGKVRLDSDVCDALEQILIESDLGVQTTQELINDLKAASLEGEDLEAAARKFLKDRILAIFASVRKDSPGAPEDKPYVILVVGVNGTGKTTTIGKMAHFFKKEGKRVLLAGADTFRAAAGEQLAIWAKRADSDIILQSSGADPASVAYDGLEAAKARHVDVLLVDTAGRLHTKVNLMEELKKIRRVLSKRMPTAPHEVLLVLDATTGQNGLVQASLFTQAVGVTGLVLAKLDGTARGGIAVAVSRVLGIPVRWAGLGEGIDDLVPFDAESFVEGLFGS
jgi:fused signal recognition particle receptor